MACRLDRGPAAAGFLYVKIRLLISLGSVIIKFARGRLY